MFKPQKRHLFLTHLVFENLWDNHRHIVLGPSLKGRRDEHKVLARQNTFILLFLSLSLDNENVVCLPWCSSPDRHSPVFSIQQFCALEDGSFVLAKRHLWTLNQRWYTARIEMQVSSPQAHLHLLGFHRRLCKRRPASGWWIPLWSVWGRRRSYCWSPLCTAERSQILSVGIEESIDTLPSGAIMNTMNILILFSWCAICVDPFCGLSLG